MEMKHLSSFETKSTSPYVVSQLSNGLFGYTGNYLSPAQAYWLWQISDAVGSACDLIAWAFEQLEPVILDKKSGEYIIDHPFLELLNNPGFRMSSDRFQFELITSYLATGECYPILVGNTKYEPLEMYTIGANNMSLVEGADGYLEYIQSTGNQDNETYKRRQIPKRKTWVYQTENNLKETKQILNKSRRQGIRGQSVLERIYYQALTKYHGNVHNNSLLQNASRPGGIIAPSERLNQDLYEKFTTEVRTRLDGPANSGRTIVAPSPVSYTNLLLNPRDMDFLKLIENSRIEIYNQYQIPLPLVVTETMTLSNYEKAVSAFYDLSVLPRAKFLYKELGKFVLPRYKNSENLELVINEKEIPALKERLFDRAKTMRGSYIFTENEMRSEVGYESLGEEGDVVWKPTTLIPVEDDEFTLDNIRIQENDRLDREEQLGDVPEDNID